MNFVCIAVFIVYASGTPVPFLGPTTCLPNLDNTEFTFFQQFLAICRNYQLLLFGLDSSDMVEASCVPRQ